MWGEHQVMAWSPAPSEWVHRVDSRLHARALKIPEWLVKPGLAGTRTAEWPAQDTNQNEARSPETHHFEAAGMGFEVKG